jgi:hypothetical protein
MLNALLSASFGFLAAIGLGLAIFFWFKQRKSKPDITVHSSIEQIRSVGELVVFKVLTKEIVTADDHWFGQWGKKYMRWLASSSKMAMIFEFELDFRYDLQSSDFEIEQTDLNEYLLQMPACLYNVHIRDIHFYDESGAKLLPWLLPDLLNRAFGPGFNEDDKNKLKEEAKMQASEVARKFVENMKSEVQTSAEQTLSAIAMGLGAINVSIDFRDTEPVETKVDSSA